MRAAHAIATAALILAVAVGIVAVLNSLPPSELSAGVSTSGEVAGAAAVSPAGPLPFEGLPHSLVRSHDAPEGTVAVVWLDRDYLRLHPEVGLGFDPQRYLIFRVFAAGPALGVSVWDLKGMIFLRDGGSMEYGSPTWMPSEDRFWKSGLAAFPSQNARGRPIPEPESRSLEIVIRGLPGPKERTFRWDLAR